MTDQTSNINALLQILENAKPLAPTCKDYYCTTCGGKSGAVRDELTSFGLENLASALIDPTEFGLSPNDFNYYLNRLPYAGTLNISPKVEFLADCFSKLDNTRRRELVMTWLDEKSHWPLWLFDGISYYFIANTSHSLKEQWKKEIESMIENSSDLSLTETYNLKFK